jgi:hypothetical protein
VVKTLAFQPPEDLVRSGSVVKRYMPLTAALQDLFLSQGPLVYIGLGSLSTYLAIEPGFQDRVEQVWLDAIAATGVR